MQWELGSQGLFRFLTKCWIGVAEGVAMNDLVLIE